LIKPLYHRGKAWEKGKKSYTKKGTWRKKLVTSAVGEKGRKYCAK